MHAKEPSLLNGHECRLKVKICSPSPAMLTSPNEWKNLECLCSPFIWYKKRKLMFPSCWIELISESNILQFSNDPVSMEIVGSALLLFLASSVMLYLCLMKSILHQALENKCITYFYHLQNSKNELDNYHIIFCIVVKSLLIYYFECNLNTR